MLILLIMKLQIRHVVILVCTIQIIVLNIVLINVHNKIKNIYWILLAENIVLVVVKDKELRAEIEKATGNSCYGAPVLFLINTKKDNMFGERDASAAAENIMLEATDMGLGSVYVMGGAVKLNDFADIQKELGIAQDFETTVIVPVGKIAEEPAKEDRTSRYQVTIY